MAVSGNGELLASGLPCRGILGRVRPVQCCQRLPGLGDHDEYQIERGFDSYPTKSAGALVLMPSAGTTPVQCRFSSKRAIDAVAVWAYAKDCDIVRENSRRTRKAMDLPLHCRCISCGCVRIRTFCKVSLRNECERRTN